MATEGSGGLGSNEEVRELQLMGPTLQSVAEDSMQNTSPWLESYIRKHVREAFEHFVKSGPAMVGGSVDAFLMEDSTENTFPWLDSYFRRLVREAFEHFVKSGPVMVGGSSLRSNRMATEGNGGLGSSEDVREGQHMGPTLESVSAFPMEDSTQNTSPWLESYIRNHACEEYELFAKPSPALVGGREQIQEPDRRILQLRFQTSMPDHFFVGKKVKWRDDAICVKLIDATTGHVVESGPLSSLTLDVVVLAGDFKNKDDDGWTWEDFKSNVETRREGKGPLLEGDLQVPLKKGVGFPAEFKFTDISTCRRSGKFRLGVQVESGFFKGIRVREAKTAAFKVKHYKKESEKKHFPRALDDDVCTLKSIGKKGPFRKNLNDVGIFKVEDFLWKRCLDPERLRKILGKNVSAKNWKTLGDHAKESVPSGKYHVYYADNTKNSGVVFKNMSELCGLFEDGKYYSAETLSDSQKVFADTMKKEACANWNDIVEYDSLQLLEMNPIERARSSQTDVVTGAPKSCPSGIDQLVSPAFLTVPSGEASENSMPDFEDHIYGPILDDDLLDWPSPSPDPSEQADGNTALSVGSLDAFCREVDLSQLPESSRDPSEQADGNRVFSAHGGSLLGGGGIYYQQDGRYNPMVQGNAIWEMGSTSLLQGNVNMEVGNTDPSEQADGNKELSVGTHGGSFEQGKQLGCSNSPRIEKGICFKSRTWSEGMPFGRSGA